MYEKTFCDFNSSYHKHLFVCCSKVYFCRLCSGFCIQKNEANGYSFTINGHTGRTWGDGVDAISYYVEGIGGDSFSLLSKENFMYWNDGARETYFNVDGYTGRIKQDGLGVISYQFDDLDNGAFTIEDIKRLMNELKKSNNTLKSKMFLKIAS